MTQFLIKYRSENQIKSVNVEAPDERFAGNIFSSLYPDISRGEVLSVSVVSEDFSWPVVGANWFLISVAVFVSQIGGNARALDELAGRLLGGLIPIAVLAAIPVAVLYLAAIDKMNFRFRRSFTFAAWFMLGISLIGRFQ